MQTTGERVMNSIRRFLSVAVVAVAVGAAGLLQAWASGAAVPYSPEAFKAAQASGSPILVEIHADWCPTCKAQMPILERLTADPKFKDLKVFRVDLDAVDLDRLQGRRRKGSFGRRHRAGLDRGAARQEPLIPDARAGAGLRGRTAVDRLALRAAAGADRAGRGGEPT
jgi:thiol-disulfide isomerase/thioredoxin